ncbi:unnamed protein product [Pleuronectes platessa]|uniref:Uncharacterized protein n=1 Tax=Pleuronectes platessa TaxID=8262 RepID=A0A9N7UGI3_PLEPL|nr:unnamed protein product [Pleuronectes platessa]
MALKDVCFEPRGDSDSSTETSGPSVLVLSDAWNPAALLLALPGHTGLADPPTGRDNQPESSLRAVHTEAILDVPLHVQRQVDFHTPSLFTVYDLEETSCHVEEEFGFTSSCCSSYKQKKKNEEVGLSKTKVLPKSKEEDGGSVTLLIICSSS